MRKFTHILPLFSLAIIWIATSVSLANGVDHKMSPGLAALGQGVDSLIPLVVFLEKQPTLYKASSSQALSNPRRVEHHLNLVRQLQNVSRSSTLGNSLSDLVAAGDVIIEREFWIADVVALRAKPTAIAQLAALPEVHYLVEDAPLQLIEPVSIQTAAQSHTGSWSGIDLIGARELWEQGYTGHGRLVCNFDTGVEGDHPALAGRWRGETAGTAAAWFDPFSTTVPTDLAGHGTHTMGIMVGRDGADTIGVAFNAEWMSAAVIDRGQSLSRTISDIIAAFEWVADPDGNPETVADLPDVLCNSWGIPKGLMSPCDETFWQAIDNLEALGVVAVFACGNEGPDAATIRNPADRASGPGNAFSVGAVDQTLLDLPVAEFSSRGPGNCADGDIKPEIVAPGVAIRSSYKGGGYKTISGTSMAAPLVAGAIALLREYNPDATVEQIKNALLASARDLGPVGEDNDYGWGMIDVAAALEYLPLPSKPHLELSDISVGSGAFDILASGATSAIGIVLTNQNMQADDLWARLQSANEEVLVLQDSVYFGSATNGGQVTAGEDAFLVKLNHLLSPGTPLDFTLNVYSENLGFLNALEFTLVSDQPAEAAVLIAANRRLSVTLSNFGLTRNLTAEILDREVLSGLSLLVADELGNVFDAVPGDLDWLATEELQSWQSGDLWEGQGTFISADGSLEVTQTALIGLESGFESYLILEYEIRSLLAAPGAELQVGVAIDLDLDGGESLFYSGSEWLARTAGGQTQIGVRCLLSDADAISLSGELYKSGAATEADKLEWLTTAPAGLSGLTGDQVLMLRIPQAVAGQTEPLRFALVIAVGNTGLGIDLALQQGTERYLTSTGVEEDEAQVLPKVLSLSQNYPNPFNNETVIEFALPSAGEYRFEIYNLLGQLVHSEAALAAAGTQQLRWQGTDSRGKAVASGVYLYRLSFAGNSLTRKLVLLK